MSLPQLEVWHAFLAQYGTRTKSELTPTVFVYRRDGSAMQDLTREQEALYHCEKAGETLELPGLMPGDPPIETRCPAPLLWSPAPAPTESSFRDCCRGRRLRDIDIDIQHSPNTPTTGLRERGNDTSKSTGRSGRQKVAARRNMRREERVTVQGPVKEQQPDGMSHRGVSRTHACRGGARGGAGGCYTYPSAM